MRCNHQENNHRASREAPGIKPLYSLLCTNPPLGPPTEQILFLFLATSAELAAFRDFQLKTTVVTAVHRSVCPHLPPSWSSVPLSSATFFPLPIASAHRSVLCYLQQMMLLFWIPPEHYYPQ